MKKMLYSFTEHYGKLIWLQPWTLVISHSYFHAIQQVNNDLADGPGIDLHQCSDKVLYVESTSLFQVFISAWIWSWLLCQHSSQSWWTTFHLEVTTRTRYQCGCEWYVWYTPSPWSMLSQTITITIPGAHESFGRVAKSRNSKASTFRIKFVLHTTAAVYLTNAEQEDV